jgi:Protein of unknown function (DUF2490)
VSAIRLFSALFAFCALLPAASSAQTDQLLPELDVYYKVKPEVRIWFQAKGTREGGEPLRTEIGPSLDLYLKAWIKLAGATAFDLDDSKSRPLIFSVGYRVMPAPDVPLQNRLEPVLTFNFPMKGNVLMTDRNRADLDWQNGEFSWRYRNRLTFERALRIRRYHPAPYVAAEVFYTSQYSKWSDTALYLGCLFPFGKHVEFNPYYEHQNNTGRAPNQQLEQLGLTLNLYFWR